MPAGEDMAAGASGRGTVAEDEAAGWAEVESFLREVLPGAADGLPAGPARTTDLLGALLTVARTCRQRTHHSRLVTEEKRLIAEAYRSEGARIKQLLAAIGLAPDQLSQSGSHSLHVLASSANELGLRDTSSAAFALRMTELMLEESKAAEHEEEMAKWTRYLVSLRKAAAARADALQVALEAADAADKENEATAQGIQAQLPMYQRKQEEYAQQTKRYQRQLKLNGFNPRIQQEHLLERSSEVQQLEADLAREQQALDEFGGIPTDPAAARVANATAAKKLAALRLRIEDHIAGGPGL